MDAVIRSDCAYDMPEEELILDAREILLNYASIDRIAIGEYWVVRRSDARVENDHQAKVLLVALFNADRRQLYPTLEPREPKTEEDKRNEILGRVEELLAELRNL